MARKNIYKINDIVSVDDDEFYDDDERFDDADEYLEDYERARPDIEDYPDDIDEDDLDRDFRAERREERRRNKKTRSEKFHYRGKYELLPEKENNKQLKFYFRLFRYRASALISGIVGIALGFVAWKYNLLFALLVILAVIPGVLWGLIGLIKTRTKGIIIIIIGLVLNAVAIIMILRPLLDLVPHLQAMGQLFKDYLNTVGI